VLQLEPLLAGYSGDLLILYGDTPLFRPTSIRGLLNRHRLRQADLTLLVATVDQPHPYGRIIRDVRGSIVDVVEEQEASSDVRAIRELNLGVYAVRANTIFGALHALPPSPVGGDYRLTDCVHQMLRSGLRVESYQTYDQDEVLGINTPDDLAQAGFIVQKRLFRPRRHEEQNMVTFGTGGWRAIIGEGFTMHNVRRLCQALANAIIRRGEEKKGVVIGFDRRFLSDLAAAAAAEVFAGNNIPVILISEDAPTPLIEFATARSNAAFGLAFTASHNPPEWNGLKVFHGDGSLLLDDETRQIEAETNALTLADVVKIEENVGVDSGVIQRRDFSNEYIDAVESRIDMAAIRKAHLRVMIDAMYGTGHLTLNTILTEARCRSDFIHERHNPLFGGRSPAPDLGALRLLMTHVREEKYDLGLATDGDADRLAIVDELGGYVSTNDILLLVYYYLHEVRGERGGVVRNLATTHLLDRLAAKLGEQCYEVPVGFKHITAGMLKHNALLGGESSGGLTIRGHILGKDGIFASALMVEMIAKMGPISRLRQRIYGLTGRLYAVEANIPATAEMKIIIPRRLAESPLTEIAGNLVQRMSGADGVKFYMDNDNWLLLRFSGTEPVLRIFAEADSEEKGRAMIAWLKDYAGLGQEAEH
jgi:phosphomannomutase